MKPGEIRLKIHHSASDFRSLLLYQMIEIERKMDILITRYFCRDVVRMHELCELVLYSEKITLNNKRLIFNHIVHEYFSNVLPDSKEVLKGLADLIPHRNYIAHLEVDLHSDEAVKGYDEKIIFKKYSKGKLEKIIYDKETTKKVFGCTKSVLEGLNFLLAMPLSELIKHSKPKQ